MIVSPVQVLGDVSCLSVRADSDRPTQRPASSGVQITVSATGVLQLPDHVCGTRCQYTYGIVTVSDSLNGC